MEAIKEIIQIKQVVQESSIERYAIHQPEHVADIAYKYIGEDDREVLLVLCLDTKNTVIAAHRAHVGALNQSIVTPREVFKAAILNNAASIVIAHQHPSGDTEPSSADVQITKRIYESSKILGIELLDSLIVGEKRQNMIDHTSLKEKGYL